LFLLPGDRGSIENTVKLRQYNFLEQGRREGREAVILTGAQTKKRVQESEIYLFWVIFQNFRAKIRNTVFRPPEPSLIEFPILKVFA
jgi:hypothetical protein